MEIAFNPTQAIPLPDKVFINQVRAISMLQIVANKNPRATFYMPAQFAFLYRQLLRRTFTHGISVVEMQNEQIVCGVKASFLSFFYNGEEIEDKSDAEMPQLQLQESFRFVFKRVQDIIKLLNHFQGKSLIFNFEMKNIVLDIAQMQPELFKTTDKAKFLIREDAAQRLKYMDYYIILEFQAPIITLSKQQVQLTEEKAALIMDKMRHRDMYLKALYKRYPQRPDWMRDVGWEDGDYDVLPVK